MRMGDPDVFGMAEVPNTRVGRCLEFKNNYFAEM